MCVVSFIGQVHWRPAQFTLVGEVKTDAPAWLQLCYHRGQKNPQDGIATAIIEKTGEFVPVRFPIEINNAYFLRIVNLGFGRTLELRSLALKPLGGPPRPFSAAELAPDSPNPTATRFLQTGNIIRVESNGTQPLVIHLAPGSRVANSTLASLLQWIFCLPLLLGAAGLLWSWHRWPSAKPDPGDSDQTGWFETTKARTFVVSALISAYFLTSFLGFNGSSTAFWRYYADREMPTAGVLAGFPQAVRSDEWVLQTPWIFSQARQNPRFPVNNPSIGGDETPLVTNLPVRHWSTILRPQMWPFFLAPTEAAFGFYWNFKTFGLLIGAFLFFGVVTGKKILLDLAGALFVTFCPFLQWWFSTPTSLPEMVAMILLALWLSATIARARARWQILVATPALVMAVENFLLCCYPRFQVPLAYFAAALLLGGLVPRPARDNMRRFRVGAFVFAGAAVLLLTAASWRATADIIRVTSLLSYPGQVQFTGGDFEWSRFFAPFLEFAMTNDRFPQRYENASEAAGFLFLAPFLLIAAVRDAIRKKADPVLLVALALVAATICYMTVGIPMWAARLSGWSYVYSGRANLLVGLATAVGLIRLLARKEISPLRRTPMVVFLISLTLLLPILGSVNTHSGHFESNSTVAATALFFALVSVSIWKRAALATCALLIVPQLYACALINPVVRGLPAITESRTLRWLSEAHRRQPTGNWIVLGDSLRALIFPEFVKATGANVMGGTRCNPDYEMLAVVDPARKYKALTDQYGSIHFKKTNDEAANIEPAEGLGYTIRLPFKQDLLDRLGVSHILEVDLPDSQDVPPGFHVSERREGCRLLERDR